MFKKILNKIAGGIVGFFTGLCVGPFAAVGKLFSLAQEESIGHDLRKNGGVRPTGIIIGIPLFFAGGLVYGPIRGAILGVKEGLNRGMLKNISQEMFTYDPFYDDIITPEVANRIPESGLISYRTFRQAGLLNTTQNVSEKDKLVSLVVPIAKDNSKKASSHFFAEVKPAVKPSSASVNRRFTF